MAMAETCTCGCSLLKDVTSAEPCTCGCACCAAETLTDDQAIAQLETLRGAVEIRLAELKKVKAGS